MHSFLPITQAHECLRGDLQTVDILPGELWMYYVGIGGHASEPQVRAYLDGTLTLPPSQRELLEHAFEEMVFYP
ncbi:hypothetical protein HWD94_12745 [Pseudarthrobacter equi]|uniref:hypothetical protein n=1 Tax=Pseudarthrobacter TaxID=1742993 RepID=UPI001585C64C|nr:MULTISPECIES: hypothetical protein [Pseudarthrobacter]MCT9625983.1 hypothetical protein [Pseudarthrobacter equi]NUT72164.1 hypothetical protein [Pseudarthrobacter sp. C4D7]